MTIAINGERFGPEHWSGHAVLAGPEQPSIHSWSDKLIEFKMPIRFSPGIYNIAAKKASDLSSGCAEKRSNQLPFMVIFTLTILLKVIQRLNDNATTDHRG
jgi:hypothetical protein